MPKYDGNAKIECGSCHKVINIVGSEFDLEEVERTEREMGAETTYSSTMNTQCPYCNNTIEGESNVYEYPPGAYNAHKTVVKNGGRLIEDFPQPDIDDLID